MNEAQESNLLHNIHHIANHVESLDSILGAETHNWHEHLHQIQNKLDLIADGVAPPVNEATTKPHPAPVKLRGDIAGFQTRLDLLDDRIDQLHERLDEHECNQPASEPIRPTAVHDPRVPELFSRINALENTLSDLRSQLADHKH